MIRSVLAPACHPWKFTPNSRRSSNQNPTTPYAAAIVTASAARQTAVRSFGFRLPIQNCFRVTHRAKATRAEQTASSVSHPLVRWNITDTLARLIAHRSARRFRPHKWNADRISAKPSSSVTDRETPTNRSGNRPRVQSGHSAAPGPPIKEIRFKNPLPATRKGMTLLRMPANGFRRFIPRRTADCTVTTTSRS